jgi:phosphomannomutase
MLAATDGDADRFGMLDSQGVYYGANQLLPLIAEYLLNYRKLRGPVVRSVCTSHLVDAIAREYGLELVETRVGFKYVGDYLRRGALIGGEESGGLSVQGHVPEKDGILATLLVLELIATGGDELGLLLKRLRERFGDWHYRRLDVHLTAAAREKLFAKLGDCRQELLGRRVDTINEIDGTKYIFADGSWVMFRASGTEDVLRVYIEALGHGQLVKLTKAVKALLGDV